MATTAEEVRGSIESFATSCNENERLKAMIKDWNRVMHIRATDLNTDATLTTSAGTAPAAPTAPADMVIQSTGDILTQVFYGELSPNEPYNDGTLRIQGREDDIVRLDFVIAMLWD